MYAGTKKSYDESAVVFRLSMLEPHIQHLRERWTQDGAQGVPPHITLLYPFLPAKAWTESASQSLEALVSSISPVNVEFRDISWLSAGGVLCLRPEPSGAILRVIQALAAAFPECPPYGGAIPISSLVPHVTIAVDVRAKDRADVEREAQRRLGDSLPIKVRLDNLSLLIRTGDAWTCAQDFPFLAA